ncbi:MAG: response regulator [Ardenticatenaceae bacterium]|nr:response regulator [Ardenticatenaceae bacterium]MCB9443617.1 response regulator [Ardenticatenaceae bacterium]
MAKIYVIDDDQQLLHMVGLMLERGGHSITLINKPEEGLAKLKANRPDLLVVDVMMPNMSGHDLTRQIRATKELENLPILVLTARSQDIDRETALRSGANGYLSKPVTSQELIEQVDKLLTQKAAAHGEKAPVQGMVLALFSLRGGVGKTTLASNLAVALRKASSQEVCLVDFSPSVGQTVYHLNLKPQGDWGNLPTDESLTWPILKENLALHPTGLRVLTAPKLPQSPTEPSTELAREILKTLRENIVFTVVDLPACLSPAVWATLETADVGLHVVTPDVISVRTAVQTERVLANAGIKIKQKSFILNQVTENAQLPEAAIERGVNGRIPFKVAYDPYQYKAMVQSTPLVSTSAQSPLTTVMNRMAEVIWKRVESKIAE